METLAFLFTKKMNSNWLVLKSFLSPILEFSAHR
jgi:hypothetical protein